MPRFMTQYTQVSLAFVAGVVVTFLFLSILPDVKLWTLASPVTRQHAIPVLVGNPSASKVSGVFDKPSGRLTTSALRASISQTNSENKRGPEVVGGVPPVDGQAAGEPGQPQRPADLPPPPPEPEDQTAQAFQQWREGVLNESRLIQWPTVGDAFRRTILVLSITIVATSVVTGMNFVFNEASQAVFYK
eukprot:EG_transcript_23638